MNIGTNVEQKSKLITELKDVRERIIDLALSLDPEGREVAYLGSWSAREMLAHLAGWDETNICAAEEILAGELPGFYEFIDKDWSSYNAMLVEDYSRDNFEDLISLVEQTHAKLVDEVTAIPAVEIWNDRGIRAREWKVTIGSLLTAELQDEEEHYWQLKTFVEDGEKS
jgi:hypothetical protein